MKIEIEEQDDGTSRKFLTSSEIFRAFSLVDSEKNISLHRIEITQEMEDAIAGSNEMYKRGIRDGKEAIRESIREALGIY